MRHTISSPEISELFGRRRDWWSRVWRRHVGEGFPAPLSKTGHPLWKRQAVLDWFDSNGGAPGTTGTELESDATK